MIKPDGTREELPPLVYEAVQHVIEAMCAGMAVKVSPFRPELPIDEAAAAIGMAKDDLRYYVAAGELPFRSTEYVDWVRLSDVMAFDRRRREHCRAGVRELLDEEPWDEASDDLRQE